MKQNNSLITLDIATEKLYENFKQKLIQEFKIQKDFAQLENEFMMLKQKPTQCVEEFAKVCNR